MPRVWTNSKEIQDAREMKGASCACVGYMFEHHLAFSCLWHVQEPMPYCLCDIILTNSTAITSLWGMKTTKGAEADSVLFGCLAIKWPSLKQSSVLPSINLLMTGWQQRARGPVCPVSWPFCHWCELWSILHMTHYRTCYNSWPFSKIHGRCQMSGATCGVVVYRLWDFYEPERAKVLFRLFNTTYAIYYCISTLGNAKYSLLGHRQFCMDSVTPIESEVISPGSVLGGGCCTSQYYDPVWQRCLSAWVGKTSFIESCDPLFTAQTKCKLTLTSFTGFEASRLASSWGFLESKLIIYKWDAGLGEETHCFASVLNESNLFLKPVESNPAGHQKA